MRSVKSLSCVLILLALVGCAPQGSASSSSSVSPRSISVAGSARVMVVPDEVILTLGVETSDTQLAVARSKNDDIVAGVVRATEALGVDSNYVQTDYMSIEPRYQDSYSQRTLLGYWTRKNIVITLDVTQFEAVLSRCLEGGVNYVQGIQFRTTELRKHRDEARSLAIKAAREKATAMAGDLGQGIGEPLSIHEEYSNWYSPWNSWWGASYGQSSSQNVVQNAPSSSTQEIDTELPLGQIGVDASVIVEFALKSSAVP